LPAVGGRHDASGASDLRIPLLSGGTVGGVDSHSRADGIARPGKRVKAALSCHRRENGARRVGEGREERIARGRRDRPVVRRNRLAKDPVARYQSANELALGTRGSGRILGRVQTGLLRLYALALASGLAVLVVVFISVR